MTLFEKKREELYDLISLQPNTDQLRMLCALFADLFIRVKELEDVKLKEVREKEMFDA